MSRPTQAFDDLALEALVQQAARLNALDGITGLLVFNGQRFCQTIEGTPGGIDDLIGRLKRDPRHTDIVVTADTMRERPRQRSWDMRMSRVDADGRLSGPQAVRDYLAEVDPDGAFWKS